MNYDPLLSDPLIEEDKIAYLEQDAIGFKFGDRGTHTSRTIMLAELKILLHSCPMTANKRDYRAEVIDHNCLGKRTVATRKLSYQRLSEMYGLDSTVLIFSVLRRLWESDAASQPLLAMLIALARDPLLRYTAAPILRLRPGEELSRQTMIDALDRSTGSRYNESILDKIVRNASSSWTQSGHLAGRNRKKRQFVRPSPIVVTFAMVLGYILGARGAALFETFWSRVLDASPGELIQIALDAKRLGFVDLTVSGGVVEASPLRILSDEERRSIHGKN